MISRSTNWYVSVSVFPETPVLTAVQSTVRTGHKDEPHSEAPVLIKDTELHPETDLENNIIGWDSQDDPENPK